jgi:hypothetical protein
MRWGAFSLQRPKRGASCLVKKEIRNPSSGIQFAFTFGVQFKKHGGNNNANRDNRKNYRSP